jgi:hypothetical protein
VERRSGCKSNGTKIERSRRGRRHGSIRSDERRCVGKAGKAGERRRSRQGEEIALCARLTNKRRNRLNSKGEGKRGSQGIDSGEVRENRGEA